MNAELLVSHFWGSVIHRREILAVMEDISEHVTIESPDDGNGSYYTRESEPLRIYTGI